MDDDDSDEGGAAGSALIADSSRRKTLLAEKFSIVLPCEMNRDGPARDTQRTRGKPVDGELDIRCIAEAKDDVLVRLDVDVFPGVQETIYHLSSVRRGAEPTRSARLHTQLQPIRFVIDRRWPAR